MKAWVRFGVAVFSLGLSNCAVVDKQGILLSVEPATPLDRHDLRIHCDLGDQAACILSQPDGQSISPRFAIVQGIAPTDRAVFAALLPKDSTISWFIYDREIGRLWKLHDSRRQQRPGNSWYVQRVEARELVPGRTYELLAGDKRGNLVEVRSFQTLHSKHSKLRFAAINGVNGSNAKEFAPAISGFKPQFIIFSGDNINTHLPKKGAPIKRSPALDWFFERHMTARQELVFGKERDLTPLVGIWNEAEYGTNEGDRSFIFRDEAREVFEMFFPVWADEVKIVNGPGISKAFSLAGQRLAFLDDFSFRHPILALPACPVSKTKTKSTQTVKPLKCRDARADEAPRSRFGLQQSLWAAQQAKEAKGPIWFISARSWLGGLPKPISVPLANAESWLAKIESKSAISLTSPPSISFVESASEDHGLKLVLLPIGSKTQEAPLKGLLLPWID
jgi:hypothetical protein